jgi:hypothetical protein
MGGFSGDYEKSGEDLRAMIKSADIMGWLTDPKTGKVDTPRLDKFLNVRLDRRGPADANTLARMLVRPRAAASVTLG